MPTSELVDIDPKVLETEGRCIGYSLFGLTPSRNTMLGYACYKWEGNLYIYNIKETESGIVKTVHKITY